MEGKSALASFGSFAKDIVKQIISTFLRMTVVNKILNHVFSGLSGYTPMGTAKPSDFPNPFSKAGGGTVQAGRPTLVGERGAEIFVPNSSGRIMNNADSQGAGGGGGVVINQNINFSTGVVGQVRSELAKLMPQISDTTKAAVLEASQRGGSFRKGLMGA
jgi:phage-related minor tail protein